MLLVASYTCINLRFFRWLCIPAPVSRNLRVMREIVQSLLLVHCRGARCNRLITSLMQKNKQSGFPCAPVSITAMHVSSTDIVGNSTIVIFYVYAL